LRQGGGGNGISPTVALTPGAGATAGAISAWRRLRFNVEWALYGSVLSSQRPRFPHHSRQG